MLAGGAALQSALDGCQSITLTCWFYHPGDARHALMSRFGSGFTNQFNHFIDLIGNFTIILLEQFLEHKRILIPQYSVQIFWTLSHNTYDVSTGVAKWYMNGQEVATANLGTDSGNGLSVSSSTDKDLVGCRRADYVEFTTEELEEFITLPPQN